MTYIPTFLSLAKEDGNETKIFCLPQYYLFSPLFFNSNFPVTLCLTTQLAEYHWDKQQEVSTNRKQTKEIGYSSCSGVSLWFRLFIVVSHVILLHCWRT